MSKLVITERITVRESDSFKKYLQEVACIEQFESAAEEHECAVRAYNGDKKAKSDLIQKNLRFVISVAKQFIVKGVSLEDLVNEGNIGITTAADRFNPEKGHKFISYAVWWIRKEIQGFLNAHSRTIRIPNNRVDGVFKYKKLMGLLEQELEREVYPSDMLHAYSDYTKDEIKILEELTHNDMTSLDMEVGEDGAQLSHLIADSSMGGADDLVIKSDILMNINTYLSTLKPIDRDIVTKLNGLDGKGPSTLADVGLIHNMSRESVRQRRDKAYKIIKNSFFKDVKITS